MKKSVRILAIAMVAVMICLTLASCGKKLSGTYEPVVVKEDSVFDKIANAISDATDSGVEYTFSGSKVTIETTVLGKVATFEGKYKIKDDKITFTFDDEDAKDYNETLKFEELENGNIKIGVVEYKLVDEK